MTKIIARQVLLGSLLFSWVGSHWSHHLHVDDGDDKKLIFHNAFDFHKTFSKLLSHSILTVK